VKDAAAGRPVRVAVDLLGGDTAPHAVVDGALLVADERPGVAVTLVGPVEQAQTLLAERGAAGRFTLVAASQVVEMTEDPARAIRTKRDATVRVASRLVRDGEADAVVSIGSTGAALAAAVFTLGRVRGVSRPALAAIVPAAAGPLVLLDAGASTEATPELLAQFALAGAALATVRLGIESPRVGLLSVGQEPGKGDELRKAAHAALSALPLRFVGNVEGGDVPNGGPADVVVTDGFTGNVLAKGLEGAAAMLTRVMLDAMSGVPELADGGAAQRAVAAATAHMSPEALGGAVLMGVDGVVVVGHGASTPRAVAACIDTAAQAVTDGLVPRIGAALADLRTRSASSVQGSA